MTRDHRGQHECEPPRYLRSESEDRWHLRDLDENAGCTCVPLCQIRYENHDDLVRSVNPLGEPLCPDCSTRYLDSGDDDPELTASIMVGMVVLSYIERTPRMEQLLKDNAQARDRFSDIKCLLYHVSESLILTGMTKLVLRAVLERVIAKALPSQKELAEEERRIAIAKKFAAPIGKLADELFSALFPKTDDEATAGEDTGGDSENSPITWSAVLAPVGVLGETGQIISPECVITVREGALLSDAEGTPIGRVDSATVVDGYITVTGVLDEATDLSVAKPTFDGSPYDRRLFGPPDNPTVTFETLEIGRVWFGRSPAPAWSDPMIAFARGSSRREKAEETPSRV